MSGTDLSGVCQTFSKNCLGAWQWRRYSLYGGLIQCSTPSSANARRNKQKPRSVLQNMPYVSKHLGKCCWSNALCLNMFSSPKEFRFSVQFVCVWLSVCLSARLQKNYWPIFMNLGRTVHGPKKNPLHFRGDPNHGADTQIIFHLPF